VQTNPNSNKYSVVVGQNYPKYTQHAHSQTNNRHTKKIYLYTYRYVYMHVNIRYM